MLINLYIAHLNTVLYTDFVTLRWIITCTMQFSAIYFRANLSCVWQIKRSSESFDSISTLAVMCAPDFNMMSLPKNHGVQQGDLSSQHFCTSKRFEFTSLQLYMDLHCCIFMFNYWNDNVDTGWCWGLCTGSPGEHIQLAFQSYTSRNSTNFTPSHPDLIRYDDLVQTRPGRCQ